MSQDAVDRQQRYYQDTAAGYDDLHDHQGDEHYEALGYVVAHVRRLGLKSIVDVGAGTGRSVLYLKEHCPGLRVVGIEPVPELVEVARSKGLTDEDIVVGDGETLPYPDASFDAAVATGVLHHVAAPSKLIAEMCRVSRVAVFLSDNNRYGHGRPLARAAKLLLGATRTWPIANRIKTGGRGWRWSEGDGVSYSYSVFDNASQLASWADRVVPVPVGRSVPPSSTLVWLSALGSPHVLLCAFRSAGRSD